MIRNRPYCKKTDIHYLLIFFFLFSFSYFYWFGDHILFFQEKQCLFIFSGEYLKEYFIKPGGPLGFAGDFLSRFYINPFIGTVILSASLVLPGFVLFKINNLLFSGRQFISAVLVLAPLCLLLLMQTHYYHQLEYNLGFLMVFLYFLYSLLSDKRQNRYIVISFFPLVYYMAGAYVWIFFAMYILYSLMFKNGKRRYVDITFVIIIAGISLIVFKSFIFLQPTDQLFLYPLPLIKVSEHRIIFFLLTVYTVIYPLIIKVPILFGINKKYSEISLLGSIIVLFSLTIFFLFKLYNSQTRLVFQLQKYVYAEKWEKAIELHETSPSKNLIGQYFYNIALSETGQLCDRLFNGRQDFGAQSLILPWRKEHLNRGAYAYYSLGLINEAHRWAYESMVVYGYYPQNIKLLAKTNLINGNYRMAEKYINMLNRSLNYRDWAKEYEKMLYNPEGVKSHPELGEKLKFLPQQDFFIQANAPYNNIELILKSNPGNVKAFEYKMALFLLTKNVEAIVNSIKEMKKIGYDRIPLHIEEAILVYLNMTRKLPDLHGFMISRETRERFDQYTSDYKRYRNNPQTIKYNMRSKFSNTFWYYLHFNES